MKIVMEPSREQRKALWRQKAFLWLRDKRGYCDVDLETCLKHLESRTHSREAAVAAFWDVYLAKQGPALLDPGQVQRIESMLQSTFSSSESGRDMATTAFVQLHLCGTFLVSLLRGDRPFYTPLVSNALEMGLKAANLLCDERIEIPEEGIVSSWSEELFEEDLFRFSAFLVSGIVFYEAALSKKEEGEYEEAFSLMRDGSWLLYLTLGDDAELPHSGHELDLQDAADIFEEIKQSPRYIRKWDTIVSACRDFDELSWRTIQYERSIINAAGEETDGLRYWSNAITTSELLSNIYDPRSLVRTKDEVLREEIAERLKRDFFGGLWEEMDEKVRQMLVGAEVQWWNGRLGNMVRDIRRMLELVLPSVFPLLSPTVRGQAGRGLILTNMIKKLEEETVQASINIRHRSWVSEHLLGFLREVRDVRNYFEHEEHLARKRSKDDKAWGDKARLIHHRLLGIESEGVLPRLLRIKRAARLQS